MARSNLTTVLFAAVLLSAAHVSVHAQSLGGYCVANSYSPTTTSAPATTVGALKLNANSSLSTGSCLPSLSTGFFTIKGFVTSTAAGKGLGVTAAAQQASISDVSSSGTFTAGTGLSLYFAVTNAVNRGDYIQVVGYLTSISGSAILEVCATPTYPLPTGGVALPTYSAAAYTATTVTTAMFSASSPLNGAVGAPFVTPLLYNSTYQPNGGACLASNKGYDGSLVTFSNVKALPCANAAVSNLLATSTVGGVVAAYRVCNPSMTPLADTIVSGVCTTCLYDKYSQFFITSDNGVTGITVSSKFFRAFATYQMPVGATFSITGLMTYSGPGSGANSQWMLIPRDQNDVTGLTALGTSSSYPTVLIGDFVNGVKQQQYKFSSPGPTLDPYIDPNGVTAASKLPLGAPANLLGPLDTIDSAGSTYKGTGVYFPALATTYPGTPGTPGNPNWNGCPNASSFTWMYNQGSTYQNLCTCYPPRYYSAALGNNGGGTSYVKTTGIVSFIEGVTTGTGVGSFFMQSGCSPNQQLYVYQDGAAGKSVSIGDNVTITASAYAYYGLVQMSNTIDVVVNSRNNAVCPPIQLTDLSVLDVGKTGHCSANTVLYRANTVTIKQVTVTKLVMYEPYPLNFAYFYNGTSQALYSAGFNSTIGRSGKALGGWGPGTVYSGSSSSCSSGLACGNWFNSDPAKTTSNAQVVHPVTKNSFPATFEVTDGYGNYLLIDQCPYGSQGGLLNAFLGTDGVTTPLAVGDTFLSITGNLKYSRGGTYRTGAGTPYAQGGNLMLCATSDPNLLVGRNQPFPLSSGAALAYYSASLSGVSGATFSSTPLMQSAFKTGVSNLANVTFGSVNITAITDISTRRHLLAAGVNVAFSIASASAGTAAAVGALMTSSALSTALATSFVAVGLAAPTVNSLQGTSSTTVDDKNALKLGLGLGIGLGLGLVLILVILYFTVLKKKNIQAGQRSAVMLSPMPAPAEGKA